MPTELSGELQQAAHDVLGYLNLSSGTPDARFLRQLNALFAALEAEQQPGQPWNVCERLHEQLRAEIVRARGTSAAFRETSQAEAVLDLVFARLLPAYREFHRDLLFHQPDSSLFRPFFLGRACEAVLQEGSPWDEPDRIIPAAIERLNDFIGHRPVAVLHNQRMEPYKHEWVRPIPLYIDGAGVAVGRYHDVITIALEILRNTDRDILDLAYFDLERMEELALDPRAYDFDHPANQRINYQFGQWDPNRIDNRGQYRRFVITQVTIDALLERTTCNRDIPFDELLFEAAAVLAGTMLMASGVSGRGPDTHDSTTTLATLLPRIAHYRDVFYQRLLAKLDCKHGERLREEARVRQQPFADARQHLNRRLARLRAIQQQHVYLAGIFAKMGFTEASRRQVAIVPVASARMMCEIHCRVTSANLSIKQGDLAGAAALVGEIEDLLHRAIECGAMIDPWNLLGFGAHFSLFPALENSIRDVRADDLIDTMRDIFALRSRIQSEAAAAGQAALAEEVANQTDRLAQWWDRFASVEVSEVEGFSGKEAADSARHVARALGDWHQAGAAAGDIAFWRSHVDQFNSTKAYAEVVAALLDQQDLRGSAALMMAWLSNVELAPLEDGDHSFNRLALRWMNTLRLKHDMPREQRWQLLRWFFDYLEANAGEYWEVPAATWPEGGVVPVEEPFDEDDAEEEEDEDPFAAAYEGVVYRDSTRDGVEGELFDPTSQATEYELDQESARLHRRIGFLATLMELWRIAGVLLCETVPPPKAARKSKKAEAESCPEQPEAEIDRALLDAAQAWLARCVYLRQALQEFAQQIHRHPVPQPSTSHESMVEYDRRQYVKEMLLDHAIRTVVSAGAAIRSLLTMEHCEIPSEGLQHWEEKAVQLLRAARSGKPSQVQSRYRDYEMACCNQPLLYVPVSRGGEPKAMVVAQTMLQTHCQILTVLPRLGRLDLTCNLLHFARESEIEYPVGRGAVSEFDRLFTTGYRAIVEQIILSATRDQRPDSDDDADLVDCLNEVTEKLLRLWLAHSSSLRLSVLEPLMSDVAWRKTVRFIEKYGHDLFVPMFLGEGNLRGIIHQGAETFLENLLEDPDAAEDLTLLRAIQQGKSLKAAAAQLECIIQALLENYAEYNDYNHTTTQSDRGEMLYCLLDFLRVKVSYDRIAWNLQPVVLVHEMLVRHGRAAAAELWRRSVADQTADAADHHIARYNELTHKYGMQLPTVADRLQERFVRGLELDCLKAMIAPAIAELQEGKPTETFDRLEEGINQFAQTPRGVGLDVPTWLTTLDDEVMDVMAERQPELSHRNCDLIPWNVLTLDKIRKQLADWE